MISAVERRTQISVDVWIRLAIIGGVLLAAAFMGRRASIEQLALLVAAGGALLLLRMPQLGLVGLIVAALSVPFTIGTGTQTPIHAVVLLIPALLVIWIGNMLLHRNVQFVRSPVNLALAAFVISVTISYIGGNLPWNIFA